MEEYTRVTNILKWIFNKDYKQIPKNVLETARERGTSVHEAIEKFYDTGEVDVPLEYEIYMDYFKDWYEEYKPELIEKEVNIKDEELKISGTFDAIVKIGKDIILMDNKITYSINKPYVECQLSLYRYLLERKGIVIDKLYYLHINKSGYSFKEVEYVEEVAESLITINKYLKERGVKHE